MTLLNEPQSTVAGESSRAILLLGHGSKAPEANETLRKVAAAVKERAGYGDVVPAFLQIEDPDFQKAVDKMVDQGYNNITVMPYFLYMGLHVTKDLPDEIARAKKKHPGLNITLAANLGFHSKLVDITVERIEETFSEERQTNSIPGTHPIEAESFRIITEELGQTDFSPAELSIIKRVIHSTADFEFADLIRISPGAVDAGITAIRNGADIITDVKMIEAGITPARLAPFGATVRCFSADADVRIIAETTGTTRTAASMRKAAEFADGGIVVIGNAPTALTELLRLVTEGKIRPALVIGTPVGFVGAVEAKEELLASDLNYITTTGRKGGSTVAVAVTNALAIEALRWVEV